MFIFILFLKPTFAVPPTPHSISGFIYDLTGATQVPIGTNYYINDTTEGSFVSGVTQFPIPGYSGYYSEVIQGVDNDNVVIRSWNETNYGETWIVLSGSMSNINVNLNLTRSSEPIVKIILPSNNTERNTSTIFEVKANITILGTNGVSCNVTISFSNNTVAELTSGETATKNIGNINRGSSNITTWQVNGTWIGTTNISVNAACSSDGLIKFETEDNIELIDNVTIIDTTPPIITLHRPLNNTWNTTNNITFHYYVNEVTGLNNCSMYLDNSLQQLELLPNTFENLSFNLPVISEGAHNWSIKCYDTTQNYFEGNGETRIIKIDTVAPSIQIIELLNNTVRSNNTVDLIYNVTEQTGIIENCSLMLNTIVEDLRYNVTKSQPKSINKDFIRGSYFWNVTCFDSAGNKGFSGTNTFNITDPELVINQFNISFNPLEPSEGQNVTITANVYNEGEDPAFNVIVQFFLDDPNSGGTQIGVNKTISTLNADSNKTIFESWIMELGEFNFFIIVDPPFATNGSITEGNETNNKANKTLFLSAWHSFYGSSSEYFSLDNSNNNSFVSWTANQTSNLFVIEANANILWTQLQAISRDTNNVSTNNDFEEIDAELNMSLLTDSVNRSFSEGGIPKTTKTMTVFNKIIFNIPIFNSTNNSNFVTGVLWDYSDGNIEYNGTQDLVFATETNNNKQGMYGIYDYELSFPVRLREYKSGSGSLTLYTEII